MKIGIGNDHVAVEYKNVIREYIEAKYGYEVINYGTDSRKDLIIQFLVKRSLMQL